MSFPLVTNSMTLDDLERSITTISHYKHTTVACTFIVSKPSPAL